MRSVRPARPVPPVSPIRSVRPVRAGAGAVGGGAAAIARRPLLAGAAASALALAAPRAAASNAAPQPAAPGPSSAESTAESNAPPQAAPNAPPQAVPLEVLARARGAALVARVDGGPRRGETIEFRLAGALLPEAWRAWGPDPAPWRAPALAALEARLVGRRLSLPAGALERAPRDAFGRPALLFPGGGADGGPLLHDLLRAGALAADALPAPPGAFAAEDEARAAGRGIWGDGFRALGPREAGRAPRGFAVVQGRAARVEARRSIAWIGFGEEPRSDLTLALAGAALAAWGADPARPPVEALAGRLVQGRGWLERRGGPYVRVAPPARLRVLD